MGWGAASSDWQSTRTGIGPASAKEHPDGENAGIRADAREAEGGDRRIKRRRRHLRARPAGGAADHRGSAGGRGTRCAGARLLRPRRATATAIAPGSCAARRGRSNTARRRLPTAARRSARRFARSFAGGPPSCREFFRDMRRRGLPDPLLVISDGAPGIIRALEECFPRALRQRCLAHKMRNLASKVPEDLWPEFKARAAACYQAPSPALARLLRDDVRATYGRDLPSAVACLEDDFEACIAHLRFPLGHRRAIRTTNLLERLFGEERRRTKVIPHAFGERAVLKLIYAALIRAAERWRGLRITEFEQRQLRAIQEEIDKDFAARNAPAATAPQSHLSSNQRT